MQKVNAQNYDVFLCITLLQKLIKGSSAESNRNSANDPQEVKLGISNSSFVCLFIYNFATVRHVKVSSLEYARPASLFNRRNGTTTSMCIRG